MDGQNCSAIGRCVLLSRITLTVTFHFPDDSVTTHFFAERSIQRTGTVTEVPRTLNIFSTEEEPMNLKLNIRNIDGVSVVDLSGRLILGEESIALRQALKDLLENDEKKLLLNL